MQSQPMQCALIMLTTFMPSRLLKIETADSKRVIPADSISARMTLLILDSAQDFGGAGRDRTDDPLLAKQVLSQLSYSPIHAASEPAQPPSLVGLVGFEPTTPALSRRCSNRLSYRPSLAVSSLNQTTDKLWALTIQRFCSRKEVIQPHLPVRLPCYDFTPVMNPTVVGALLAVRLTTSGRTRSHGVTGGVYKTRERIHRGMLIRDY